MLAAGTGLVRKDSVLELCGHRAKAIELYEQAMRLFLAAREAHGRACVGESHITAFMHEEMRYFDASKMPQFVTNARKAVDRNMWQALIVNTPIGSLMDAKEKKLFEESLRDDPAEATPENIEATMLRLASESEMIFRRGLVEAFRNLDRDYRSHDGFKIGERIVLGYVVRWDKRFGGSLSFNHYCDDRLRDVDRVVHVLDGKPAPEYQQGLSAAIRTATHPPCEFKAETDYWRVRLFKNGNAHLFPKRMDLIEKANRIIAEHYGMTIGAAPDVAKGRGYAPPPDARFSEDFFFTPEETRDFLIEVAGIEPHHTVLEPSAGEGHIAERLAEIVSDKLECVELNPRRAQTLRDALGGVAKIRQCDFLSMDPRPAFDRIIGNPPFSNSQADRHFLHAIKFLKPGGRMVFVMPAGTAFREDRLAKMVREESGARGGIIFELPPNSFKQAGTSVSAVVLVVEAPADRTMQDAA